MLVLVHSSIGEVDCYRPLCERLRGERWVVGLRPSGLRDAEPLIDDLAEMARSYVVALQRELPRGPYFLGGWAFGGVVAAEMSEQLIEAGEQVPGVALFDSRAPVPEMANRRVDVPTMAAHLARHLAGTVDQSLNRDVAIESASDVLAALRTLGAAPADWSTEDMQRRLDLFMANARALFRHQQRRLRAPLCLFESSDELPWHPKPETLGWEEHGHRVRHLVPGHHLNLLAERHVDQLALALSGELERLVNE